MYSQCPGWYIVVTLSMSLQYICSVPAWYTTLCPQCLSLTEEAEVCAYDASFTFTAHSSSSEDLESSVNVEAVEEMDHRLDSNSSRKAS